MKFKPRSGLEKYIHQKKQGIDYDDDVTVVIDGDVLSFKAASAIEARFINVKHRPSGKVKRFDNRTSFYGRGKKRDKGWLGEVNSKRKVPFLLEDFEIEDDREVEDISHALYTIKSLIDTVCEYCKTSTYEIYIEEGRNFRHNVCTVYPYKGNREGLIKPLLLKEVRKYLVERMGAVVIEGDGCIETDDMCSIRATDGYNNYLKTGKCDVVQSSNDKDAMGVEGLLINPDKMTEPFMIKGYGKLWLDKKGKLRGYGKKWLLAQMLMGDTIDNILPSKLAGVKFADKGTFKVLDETKNLREGLKAVVDKYREWYPEPMEYSHCYTGESMKKDWLGFANEFFTLLYMLRSEDDTTTFTQLLEENDIEYKD